MALVLKDRVKETTTTTGTGTLTLAGAVSGFQSFSVIGNNNTTYYAIVGGTEWEVGLGTYSSNTLARTTVLASSNSNSAVNFSAGTKDVFCTYAAEKSIANAGTGSDGIVIGPSAASSSAQVVGIGRSVSLTGTGSVAVGAYATSNTGSVVVGYYSSSSSSYCVVVGPNSFASGGSYGVTVGYNSGAYAAEAIAVGRGVSANGAYSVAVGKSAMTTGSYGVAIGSSANATGTYSVAIGPSSDTNSGSYNTAIGPYAKNALPTQGYLTYNASNAVTTNSQMYTNVYTLGTFINATSAGQAHRLNNRLDSSYSAAATNQITLDTAHSIMMFDGMIVARDRNTESYVTAWKVSGILQNTNSSADIELVNLVVDTIADAGGRLSLSITADSTLNCLNVSVVANDVACREVIAANIRATIVAGT